MNDTIEATKERYKNEIVSYTDVLRSKAGSKTLAIFDSSISRKMNNYLMGYEVLRDMFKCINSSKSI